jgi:hypothetical protein
MKKTLELNALQPHLKPRDFERKRDRLDGLIGSEEMHDALNCLEMAGVELAYAAPESEVAKPHLGLVIDSRYNLAINGQPHSLNRGNPVAHVKTKEAEWREPRAKMVVLFAEHPEDKFTRMEIWKQVMGGKPFNRNQWETYLKPLVVNPPPTPYGPLLETDKSNISCHRFGLGPFRAEVRFTADAFEIEEDPRFVLPSGKLIGGIPARVLHMLFKAEASGKPLRNEDIVEDSSFYTAEQLDNMATPRAEILTRLLSAIKSEYLKGTGIVIHTVTLNEGGPNRRGQKSGYYADYPGVIKLPGEVLDTTAEILSVYEAKIIAAHLKMHAGLFERKGLPQLPDTLINRIINGGLGEEHKNLSREEVKAMRKRATEKIIALIETEERFDRYLKELAEEDPQDIRIEMLTSLKGVANREFNEFLLELLNVETRSTVVSERYAPTGSNSIAVSRGVYDKNGRPL